MVLLTGASSGIGAHTVHFLVEKKGYRKLAIVARTEVGDTQISILLLLWPHICSTERGVLSV